MAQQTRRSSSRRWLPWAALPLVTALSASCAGCAPTAAHPEEAAVAEVTLAPLPTNSVPPVSTSAKPSVAVSTSIRETATRTSTEGVVAPLSTVGADASLPSISLIPSDSPSTDTATDRLQSAVEQKNLKAAVKAVAEGANLEAKDSYGRTVLMRAVVNHDQAMALKLLELGANPNTTDDFHESAFMHASAEGMVAVLRSAIKYGANLHATNNMGSTALSIASENGKVESIRLLLRHDVPIDHVNDLGWTALHAAIVLGQGSSNYVAVVRLLLLAGANPHITDSNGQNAMELAQERGLRQIEQTIRSSAR